MYCKKCGRKQEEGQRFCPKCGEPFLDIKEKPNQNLDGKNKLSSKVNEQVHQGDKHHNEHVQHQSNDKIEVLKNVDWGEKKKESVNALNEFFSNTDKLRIATIVVAIIAVLWFFLFNGGSSASWSWWLFAIAFVILAFYKIEAKDNEDALKKTRWTFGLAIILGLVLIFHNPSSGSFDDFGDDSSIDYNAKNDDDMRVLSEMAKIYSEIKNTLPQVEQLYNAHRQHMANGLPQTTSPAWGRWQDLYHKINGLWDDYIRLARQLDDSDDVIEEAIAKKAKMNKAFEDMFVQKY